MSNERQDSSSAFLIIRHAQSANNALPEHLRVCDPGLTPLGAQQAERLSVHLAKQPITHLYCSGFLRSIETAAPLANRLNLPVFVHSKLHEVKGCYSGYEPGKLVAEPGMGRSAILAKYAHWTVDEAINDHGWNHGRKVESEDEADVRAAEVAKWMHQLALNKPNHRLVALVIHADFKVKLLNELSITYAKSTDRPWLIEEPRNTSVSIVVFRNGECFIETYNVVSHLDNIECNADR